MRLLFSVLVLLSLFATFQGIHTSTVAAGHFPGSDRSVDQDAILTRGSTSVSAASAAAMPLAETLAAAYSPASVFTEASYKNLYPSETAAGFTPVIVAVLDTGIDRDHEELCGRVAAEINYTESDTSDDRYGHGTSVAGIIAANDVNNTGIEGQAPDCRLFNVKVADDQGKCCASDLAGGIIWAADNGAGVINVSIEIDTYSPQLKEAVDYAWARGALIVAAAGNGGTDTPVYPAFFDNCIAVTAIRDNGDLAPLANHGTWVDVAAPGYHIYTTIPDGGYGYQFGTSFAAAYISGMAAYLIPIVPDADGDGSNNDDVRQLIEDLCLYSDTTVL